ncbi:hypothetical protein [Brevibacillus fulvus]|uniref:Uncharacterized protein n=1 Tax=Brevibacillus fulvus TaxID=1125967 RepID=A0A939BPW4_9BACL|nr:hypothetical protein [Brevibacillus fulvus]MBM7590955.1 hypothetical protein [Brevibacillus fulvus]
MNEFTTGILYPRQYEEKVLHELPSSRQPYFHKHVNEDWNAFFLKDESIERTETLQFLLNLSAHSLPLLWFHDAEDSGWGYRLFDGGQEVSAATISYSLDVELAEAAFLQRYPHIDLYEETFEDDELRNFYEELLEKVVRSEQFRREVLKGISRFRPHCFAHMLEPKQLQQLCALFDINLLTDYDEETGSSLLYDSVDLFKEILGIEEMVWVNFAYLASGGREA